jgi:hypothetical protein
MYYTCRRILPTQCAQSLETTVLRERAERVHRRALLVIVGGSNYIIATSVPLAFTAVSPPKLMPMSRDQIASKPEEHEHIYKEIHQHC